MIAAPLPEIAIVPDILTDAHADSGAADAQNLWTAERFKVTVFIEDVVGGEQRLSKAVIEYAAFEKNGAVVERPSDIRRIGFRQTHKNGRSVGELARKLRG